MDLSARGYRGSLLVLAVLILTGCATSPDNATDSGKHDSPLACSGSADCAVVGGAMLLLSVITSPPNPSAASHDKKHRARSISGRCELMVGGVRKPCEGVLLTLKAPGYSRKAWIADNEFEVPGIGASKFDLEAYSEEYAAATVLKNVVAGSQIRIQLVVPAK